MIGDAGLDALKGLPALTVVNARNTMVTDAGVEAFTKANPRCKVIH